MQSHHLHLQWKFKLWPGKFAWGVKAKHCWELSTNFWKQKGVFQTEHIPNWPNSISKSSTFNLLHIPNWAHSKTNLINSLRCIGYFSECCAAAKKLLHTPLQRLETRHETCVRMFQQIEWYRDRTKSPCNS